MAALRCAVAAVMACVAGMAGGGAAASDLKVVVTIKPIHSLVARLMRGVGSPTLLVDSVASPHTFALKPSGVRAINAAHVFIRVAEAAEPFTARIVKTLPQRVRVVTLEETPGLKLFDMRRSATFNSHHGGKEDTHGARDGHIWLDPDNAKVIVRHLAAILSEQAPHHAELLRANALTLNREIDALTAELERETQPLKGKPFVVSHDALQYFDRRFGLDAAGAITVSPEVQPSARRLTELRQALRGRSVVCVFTEPLARPELIAAVTEGSKVRIGTLDPGGAMLAPGEDLYFALLRNVAAALKACLVQPS